MDANATKPYVPMWWGWTKSFVIAAARKLIWLVLSVLLSLAGVIFLIVAALIALSDYWGVLPALAVTGIVLMIAAIVSAALAQRA